MTAETTVSLAQLRRSPVNARRAAGDASKAKVKLRAKRRGKNPASDAAGDIARLAESIRHEGLLTPLLVQGPDADGVYDVLDGGRRLAALTLLAKTDPHFSENIRITLRKAEAVNGDARSAALAVNIIREPLHPVDAYEAFDALAREGFSEADIAARYMLTPREVKQRLALGQLAPEVREAWRVGEIDADEAQAFTLAADQAQQAAVLRKLKKGGHFIAWHVRNNIVGARGETRKFLTYVTREAYEAAGGRIIEDLFADSDEEAETAVTDFPLLKKLAEEKLAEACAKLLKQGWGWAEPGEKHPNRHSYRRGPKKTKEDKAAAGCVVSIGFHGKLEIDRGLLKPGAKKPAASKSKKPADPTAAKPIPFALKRALTEQRTIALQDVVAASPDLALAAAVASFAALGGPLHFSVNGFTRNGDEGWDQTIEASEESFGLDFDEALEAALAMTQEELLERLAVFTACAINTVENNPHQRRDDGVKALTAACDEGAINAALDKAFDAEAYFARAGKAHAIQAIADCEATADVAALAKKKVKELAAIAVDKARAHGWLPIELRHDRYAGPQTRKLETPKVAPAKSAKPKAAAKKTPKPVKSKIVKRKARAKIARKKAA